MQPEPTIVTARMYGTTRQGQQVVKVRARTCGNPVRSAPHSRSRSYDEPAYTGVIMRDLDRLIERHRVELKQCLQLWSDREAAKAESRLALRPRPGWNSSVKLDDEVHMGVGTERLKAASNGYKDNVHMQEWSPPGQVQAWGSDSQLSPDKEAASGEPLRPEVPAPSMPVSNGACVDGKFDKHDLASTGGGKHDKLKKKLKHPTLEPSPNHARSCLESMIASRWFETCSVLLILTNAAFIGWETQSNATRTMQHAMSNSPGEVEHPSYFFVIGCVFNVLMLSELMLRWICDGLLGFFRTDELYWNLLDLFVVATGLFDLLFEIIYLVSGAEKTAAFENLGSLRVLRLMRVVRVARVIRVMRFFRELRIMIYSIVGCMKSMIWVALVLMALFYLFGVSFTAALPTHLVENEMWHLPENQELIMYFGTLDRSVLTLYMSMCGGVDWGMVLLEVDKMSFQWRYLYLAYTILSIFAVSNIVTGIFVDSAMKSNQADREVLIHEELEAKKDYVNSLKQMFQEIDRDSTGLITLQEFESRLNSDRAVAYFKALKLDVTDARILFSLLDFDLSNQIDINEFIDGCYKLQGEASSLDTKIMQYEVRYVRESMAALARAVKDIKTQFGIVDGTSDLNHIEK